MYRVFIDGSCPKNGLESSIGGWAYIITDEDSNIIAEDFGKLREGNQHSTRAELESLYRALLKIQEIGGEFTIYTDYEAIALMLDGRSNRNANRDMWEQIEPILRNMYGKIQVEHIYSHQEGNEINAFNNKVDSLAKQGARSLLIGPVEI